jgi:hypothetical protein
MCHDVDHGVVLDSQEILETDLVEEIFLMNVPYSVGPAHPQDLPVQIWIDLLHL